MSLAALMRVNGMTSRAVIRVGQMIRLPIDGVDRPARCDAGARRSARRAGGRAATPALAATSAEGVYVVRRGDSIERIATRLGVDSASAHRRERHPQPQRHPGGSAAHHPDTRRAPSSPLEPLRQSARRRPRWSRPSHAAAESPAAVAAEPVASADLTAALAPAVLANGEPAPETDEAADEVGGRQCARERAGHAGGRPERLHGQHGQPDHRAGARDARPLRRLARDSDAAAARREFAVVP